MALVPEGVRIVEGRPRRVIDVQGNEYEYGEQNKKDHVTLSQLKLADLDRAKFAGMCVRTYGDQGYCFRLNDTEKSA